MDLFCKDEGRRRHKFTLHSHGSEWGFDTPEEVLEFVRREPEREYSIYLGEGVSFDCDEVEMIRRNWPKK